MKISLLLIMLLWICSCHGQNDKTKYHNLSLTEIMDSLKVDKKSISVLIDKSDYRLYIVADGITLKEYPVVFGKNASDDKLMQGDRCTPEGSFHMISKYPHKEWSKFIWIDYPNKSSWEKHNRAKKEGKIPRNAQIGGEVGIHGVPRGMDKLIDAKYNWTLGCISLKNKDVDEIYPYIAANTLIQIQK